MIESEGTEEGVKERRDEKISRKNTQEGIKGTRKDKSKGRKKYAKNRSGGSDTERKG